MQIVSQDKPDKSTPKPTNLKTLPYAKIEKLLQENRQCLKAIYESCEKARKYILWGRIMTLIYLIIIITPIILAIIYLPPYFNQLLEPYKELLHTKESSGGNVDQYLNILKNLNL